MNNYIELVILSYFKQNKEYSFSWLAEMLGITMSTMNNYIENMIKENLLEYKENLLTIAFKGRITLQNSDMDCYSCSEPVDSIRKFQERAWAIDKIYIPENFIEKVSR